MNDPIMYYQDQIDHWEEVAREERFSDKTVNRMLRQLQEKNARYQRVMFAVLERGEGLTLKHGSMDQWAVLLADASNPGKFRYQQFDASGFIGHVTKSSLDEAALDAFQCGFTELAADDVLVRISATEEWRIGSIRNDLIRKVNCGELTHEEADRQYEALVA